MTIGMINTDGFWLKESPVFNYKFICESTEGDHRVELSSKSCLTWYDVSEEFFSFLRGCGFEMTRADMASYWSEYLEDESIDKE